MLHCIHYRNIMTAAVVQSVIYAVCGLCLGPCVAVASCVSYIHVLMCQKCWPPPLLILFASLCSLNRAGRGGGFCKKGGESNNCG